MKQEFERPFLPFARDVARIALSPVLRSEIITEPGENGMFRFEGMILEGYGGVIILKHFSLKDPPQVIKDIVVSSDALIQREVLAPNALHQIYPGVRPFARMLGVKIDPIVTKNTVTRAQERGKAVIPELNEGSKEFVRDAVDYLKRGQLVVIAPEGERRNNLESYGNNSIGTLLGTARLARANVALLTLDLRVAGVRAGYWDRSWPNLLAKYEVRIGRCLTGDEIISMANGRLRDIDEKVILPEMRRTAAIARLSRG